MRKSTFIFIILSGLASFFNYATYPALAHILNNQQFVSITVALAIYTQISSFTLSIVALTIGISKQKDTKNSATIIEKLQAVLIHLFIVLLILFLVCFPLFFKQLALSRTLLAPIALMLSLSIIMSVVSGYLNGKGKLVKLGISLVVAAALQLTLSVAIGILSHSGTATMYAMSAGTILSLTFIYVVYRDENLPRPLSVFTHRLSIYQSAGLRSLLKYIVAASLAILAVNIMLILDLLVINSRQRDAKMYADIYVISRVVYFGGMLFIWPFLSSIDIYRPKKNVNLFLRLSGVFLLITLCAVFAMQLFGEQITNILFGSQNQSWGQVKELALLAILYKFNFLVITSLVMFFIVIRNYWAIWLSLVTTLGLAAFVVLSDQSAPSVVLVRGLSITSFAALLFGIYGFMRVSRRKQTVHSINSDIIG